MINYYKEKASTIKSGCLLQLEHIQTGRNQDGNHQGTDDTIEDRQNYSFLICVFQNERQGSVFTCICCGSDTSIVIQANSEKRNQNERKHFSHKITHKSNAPHLHIG